MSIEEIVLNIILLSGEAKSCAMEAIQAAKAGEFTKAETLIGETNEKLALAHATQTQLIQAEARGEKTEVTLLMVHAQDHLMTSITVKDLASELVDVYRRMSRG